MVKHISYMQEAILLAKKCSLDVLPNPSVGAVIVKKNVVLSKGHTQSYGGAHAENMALSLLHYKATGATMYCTMEPCAGTWRGKHQPSCAEIIVESGITTVYIAHLDNNPKVRGKGVAYLQSKGVKVMYCDACRMHALKYNEVYEHILQCPNMPFIHLKVAQSLDAKMTGAGNTRIRITDSTTQKKVHAIRNSHQAILTGVNTILIDNPYLDTRMMKRGCNPSVVVIDTRLEFPPHAQLLSSKIVRRKIPGQDYSVLILTSDEGYSNTAKRHELEALGAKVVMIAEEKKEEVSCISLVQATQYLLKQKIYSILLETGPKLSAAFLREQLVSKVSFFIAPKFIGEGKGLSNFSLARVDTLFSLTSMKLRNSEDSMISGYTYNIFND